MSSLPKSSTTEPSTCWAESLLAQDLYKLSMEEREKVLEELHGVSDIVNETAELIAITLAEFHEELSKIKVKKAYDAAKARDPEYMNSLELLLKFLRAARFDPVQAAARMVGFFEKKLELFGAGPLTRELRLTDLDKADRVCLKGGIMTLLPLRDRAGRGVVTWMPMLRGESTTLGRVCWTDSCATINSTFLTLSFSQLRCMMYMFSVAALEEETQRKGLVFVWLDVGPTRTLIKDSPAAQLGTQIMSVAPARTSSIHVCVGDSKLTQFWNVIRASMEPRVLTRIRFHCGTYAY
jgi:predicted HTH domain antitoxin